MTRTKKQFMDELQPIIVGMSIEHIIECCLWIGAYDEYYIFTAKTMHHSWVLSCRPEYLDDEEPLRDARMGGNQ